MFFWIDSERKLEIDYDSFFKELKKEGANNIYVLDENPYIVFLNLLRNLICGKKSVILDADFSEEEILGLGLSNDLIEKGIYHQSDESSSFNSISELYRHLEKDNHNLQIEIYTSGTTGRPKKVTQTLKNIARAVKVDTLFHNKTWGFAYNPTHFAGLQVFFQAFFNQNTLVYLFNKDYSLVNDDFARYKITHLSCTPTFMKMLIPNIETTMGNVENLTFGGEKFDPKLERIVSKKFPNASIKNIYASTEAGSLLRSEGEFFVIPKRYVDVVKIENKELLIHKELLGISNSFELIDCWYKTGDLVEFIDDEKFKFVNRKSEMINVGGYKVNPSEVEGVISEIEGVKDVIVFGRKNSVLGSIIVANIIKEDKEDPIKLKKRIKNIVSNSLQDFKIPRKISFVDSFQLTRTGKIKKI